MRRLLGRMSVQVSSRYLSHSSFEAQTPVSAHPPGTSRSAGQRLYCSSSLISTLNRASGDSKSKVTVRNCGLLLADKTTCIFKVWHMSRVTGNELSTLGQFSFITSIVPFNCGPAAVEQADAKKAPKPTFA